MQRLEEIDVERPEYCYGLICQIDAASDLLEYFAAAEVPAGTPSSRIPDGMSRVRVSDGLYAKFTHRGNVARLNETVSYIYGKWLLDSSWQHTGQPDMEFYGYEFQENSDESVVYYAIPISR